MLDRISEFKHDWEPGFLEATRSGIFKNTFSDMERIIAALTPGGNVRVGLEDSLFLGRGRLARGNAEQVTAIREILERLAIDIATPAEARERLRLKGAARVSVPACRPADES